MRIIKYELSKIFSFPMVPIFVILCLLVNLGTVFLQVLNEPSALAYVNDVSNFTKEHGAYITDELMAALEQSDDQNLDRLNKELSEIEPEFLGFDFDRMEAQYFEEISSSPAAINLQTAKFSAAKERYQSLLEQNADKSILAAEETGCVYSFLFGKLLMFLSAEGCVVTVIVLALVLHYEKLSRTENYLAATKTGRSLIFYKAAAGSVCSLVLHCVITAITLSVYFSIWDFSGIWDANVSSSFNFVDDGFLEKPFITWKSFTVSEYLAATLCMTLVLLIITALFTMIVCSLIDNTYFALAFILLFAVFSIAGARILPQLGFQVPYLISMYNPVNLWRGQPLWFSEGGIDFAGKWFETIGAGTSLAVLILISIPTFRHVHRKDIK